MANAYLFHDFPFRESSKYRPSLLQRLSLQMAAPLEPTAMICECPLAVPDFHNAKASFVLR
jgi:hypothetical protein